MAVKVRVKMGAEEVSTFFSVRATGANESMPIFTPPLGQEVLAN
jgi:hypothetical protein